MYIDIYVVYMVYIYNIYDTVITFNDGKASRLKVLKELRVKISQIMTVVLQILDKK